MKLKGEHERQFTKSLQASRFNCSPRESHMVSKVIGLCSFRCSTKFSERKITQLVTSKKLIGNHEKWFSLDGPCDLLRGWLELEKTQKDI